MAKLLAWISKYILYFNFVYLPRVWAFNYCGETICNGTEEHTLCKYSIEGPSTRCIEYERTILVDADKYNLLEKLNKRRNLIAMGEARSFPSASNMRKLVWSDALALSAQRWADQCIEHQSLHKHDKCRDLEQMPVGQNIATIVGEAPGLTPSSLVDVWYMELMNLNASVITSYSHTERSNLREESYFTQLIWANSYLVGCGGVRFKDNSKRRYTVHRLVCNFGPKGNIVNQHVYEEGIPCTNCPESSKCDEDFVALCYTPIDNSTESTTETKSLNSLQYELATDLESDGITEPETVPTIYSDLYERPYEEENTTEAKSYDDISDLLQINKATSTNTMDTVTTKKVEENPCKNVMVVDELLNIIRKKLLNDPSFAHAKETDEPNNNAAVNDILLKLYKKDIPSTTTKKSLTNDVLNSSLLVDLVEAVIFRNTGIHNQNNNEKETELTTALNPVEIKQVKVEIPSTTSNNDFDGHYFFPEDEDEEESDDNRTTEKIDSYYEDMSKTPSIDILAEINNIKSKSARNSFVEDILETDVPEEIAETTTFPGLEKLSPDDISLFKRGYKNMKIFLQDIEDKRDKSFVKM